MTEPLDPKKIAHALSVGLLTSRTSKLRIGGEIEIVDRTGSTNDDVAARAAEGAAEGFALFAETQTAGRGRKAADWIAPPRQNLTFSVLLRPKLPIADWPRFAHAAGLAVARGVEPWAEGRKLKLKWPNDVLCEGRKLAGILLETRSRRGEQFIVLGIGLNVNSSPDDFPPDLSGDVGSVRWLAGGRGEIDRNQLAGSILAELNRAYEAALADFSGLLEEIRRRSCLLGKRVQFRKNGTWIEADVTGFGPNGELEVQHDGAPDSELILSAEHVRAVTRRNCNN